MAKKENSLAHTKWMCQYHIVFTLKYREIVEMRSFFLWVISLCYGRKSVKIEQRKQVKKIMAKTFLWIEDRKGKASYTFWENLMK